MQCSYRCSFSFFFPLSHSSPHEAAFVAFFLVVQPNIYPFCRSGAHHCLFPLVRKKLIMEYLQLACRLQLAASMHISPYLVSWATPAFVRLDCISMCTFAFHFTAKYRTTYAHLNGYVHLPTRGGVWIWLRW